ncbi:hypothetical protein DUNSADRAFT_15333 [Dunaliella salina]|uniref:Encoded protein n=1 Tax=Dunaliella salina TaxID=3046 RepID=A0ABQ7G5M5_DUNSA|nr:hypothetical protein DUNSADRAFT_15333 [Dunaliella salina]|eukprot:KAF5829890.1 hypothetical protein DUNSADRAFT_15333 [Dunaliella salina]
MLALGCRPKFCSLPSDLYKVLLLDSAQHRPAPAPDEGRSSWGQELQFGATARAGPCSGGCVLFDMEPADRYMGHGTGTGSLQSLNPSPFQRPGIQHQTSFNSSNCNTISINGGPVRDYASMPAQSATLMQPNAASSGAADCLLSLCLPYDDLSHLVGVHA